MVVKDLDTQTFIFPVGKSHIRRKISKKTYNDLRGVIVDVLSDVCKLNDEGI